MIDDVLSRLQKVRKKGPGQYVACCPAHDDSDPSLSIGEAEDGRVLLKCWAGCGALDVISAIGLSWDDLFPETRQNYRSLANHLGLNGDADRVVELSKHTKRLTDSDREAYKRAVLAGGKPDGFCREVAKNLPENAEWSRQLLECERELLKKEMEFGGA